MVNKVQTAMIIDDDVDLSLLLSSFLEKRNIHTLSVHSLPEAKDFLKYLKPTVIFLDNSFPEGLGVNFISTIKSSDEEIKIIMMTADADPWIEEKAKKEGVCYFLKKPFSQKFFHSVLDDLKFKNG